MGNSQPNDVSSLTRLTSSEQAAQKCDPRSWVAEKSEWPWKPVHISLNHPNLGGRRIFVSAYNTRFKNMTQLKRSNMQRPNMKAIHLYNCCVHWELTKYLRDKIIDGGSGNAETDERISCDLMCAAALSLYSFTATIEAFCNDVEDTAENEGEAPRRLKDRVKELLKKRNSGRLPKSYHEFTRLHTARNTLTHNTSKGNIGTPGGDEFGQHEGLGQAMESVLRAKAGPPEVALGLMQTIAGRPATRWAKEVVENAGKAQ